MKLWDLFRRRADVPPQPPVSTPVRRPDWPAMRPVQRVVSAPELITAPDRFTDSLASWRNPSRAGTLGHYVTPDAPAGVSDGLAAASPRGELPAPAQPHWWPRPPAVQRHVSTSAPIPAEMVPASHEDQASSPPPAVPLSAVTGTALTSASSAVPPPPRLALPVVQRQDAESETSLVTVADPELPAGESSPEAPLPSVLAAPAEPASNASVGPAVSSHGSQPDLPVARRLGLGAPLQRIPDQTDEPAAGGPPLQATSAVASPGDTPFTVQRQEEIGAEPTDLAPLVSDSGAMASVASPTTPSDLVVIPPVSAESLASSHSARPSPSP
ncbi:MAG: hypothetical protein QOJ20_4540, partial [Mycobacterium sp.]|nr:hypothetical protein [Mycobacterium sp.]